MVGAALAGALVPAGSSGALEAAGSGVFVVAGAAVASAGAGDSAAGVAAAASRACFESATWRQTYVPTPLPNFAAPFRKNSFEPGTSHTATSPAVLHAFETARYFAVAAASLATLERDRRRRCGEDEPREPGQCFAHRFLLAKLTAARTCAAQRIASGVDSALGRALHGAPARYRKSEAACSTFARARSTAAAAEAGSARAYAFVKSGNATSS
jgi:hypothetical protein